MRPVAIAAITGALAFATPAAGEDQVQHYAPEQSETLAEAVENFAEYNGLLREVLARDDLSVADMERVHQLTYTLEIALAKINERFSALPDTLETLHLASEDHDAAMTLSVGKAYLGTAETVVPSENAGN